MAQNRYLIVSDLHLCDVEDHPDGWKRHKSSLFHYDADFDAMVRANLARLEDGDTFTLVLNGDIFDFDLVTAIPEDPPWPVRPIEHRYGLDATEPKSAWKMAHMLADHAGFLATLARLMADGHRVVVTVGNHDRELWFAAVQETLLDHIVAAGENEGLEVARDLFLVEPWFYYVADEVFIEHGHQYDYYSAFRYNLEPVVDKHGETHIALPTGNLSNRFLLSNIGFFNPHATDFILSLFGYVHHWLRYYAFTRRMLILTWFIGSLRALAALLGIRARLRKSPPQRYERHLDVAAERYGVDRDTVGAIYALRSEPITDRFFKIVREFWIDRVLLAAAMTGGTVALALSGSPLWVKLMVPLTGFPLLWFVYQWFAGDDNALTLEYKSHTYAHSIAGLLPVRAIVFGHTHVPNVIPLAHDVTFANTGTWAPIWRSSSKLAVPRVDELELEPGLRNFVLVSCGPDRCDVEIGAWMDVHARPVAPTAAAA